jgi:glycosidase
MYKAVKFLFSLSFLIFITFAGISSCNNPKENKDVKEKSENKENKKIMKHVEWSKNANIYEVNIRQYTPEGTFNAFVEHLPRLKDLGVDILWIMPVQPIGEKNRKGSLGSYYSIKDYKAVNPEFGTIEDFKALVQKAHELGMHVLLDWVANHTSWDNVWVKEHPDFYKKKEDGSFDSPYDWTDVIALNYDNNEMRDSMINAMEYWIKETDIDGYRCDMAGLVPVDFWNQARTSLDKIKDIFMLAEDEDNVALVEYAFDMNYTWKMFHILNDIAKEEKNVNDIWQNLAWSENNYPKYTYRMYFTSNHDENSWSGTVKERLGDGVEAFTVLTYMLPGMPLTYSGQEAGNDKRLRFFEKDTIDWKDNTISGLYKTLNNLKKQNVALWNGLSGGTITNINNGQNDKVFACKREKDGNSIIAVINLSSSMQEIEVENSYISGDYIEMFSGENVQIKNKYKFVLKPWHYMILRRIK